MSEMIETQRSTMEAVLRPPSTGIVPASVIQVQMGAYSRSSQSQPVYPHLYETQCSPAT